MLRFLTIGLVLMLATPATLCSNDATPQDELQDMRDQLAARLSPTETMLLQQIDEIAAKRENSWFRPPVVAACFAALIGWGLVLLQYFGNRNLRIWELLFESLRWFEKGSQRRSIGIAVVESKWDVRMEFRSRWASVLVNQAIYLLTRKKNRDAIHERANLYRIMDLLIEKVDPGGHISSSERILLRDELTDYDPKSDRGLQDLDDKRLRKWRDHFSAPRPKQVLRRRSIRIAPTRWLSQWYVNQVIALLENDLLDTDNTALMKRLERLRELVTAAENAKPGVVSAAVGKPPDP